MILVPYFKILNSLKVANKPKSFPVQVFRGSCANLTISIFLCHIAEKTVVDGEAKNGDTKEETVEEFKSRMNKLMTN